MLRLLILLFVILLLCNGNLGCSFNTNQKNVKSEIKQEVIKKEVNDVDKFVALAKEFSNKPGRENESKAVEYWQKAAELGNAEAQYVMGQEYLLGLAFEVDNEKALFWFLKAAKQGHRDAQYKTAFIFEECCVGMDKEASYWYKKAAEQYKRDAEQGQKDAYRGLADCYLNGKGIDKDGKKAFYWYEKASENGDMNALMALANCYYEGIGVSKNKDKAIELYKKVINQGDETDAFLAKMELESIQKEENN